MDSEQGSQGGEAEDRNAERGWSRWWLLLLLLPYLGLLYPPIYSRIEPELWGIPFFLWYQFLWVLITVAITGFVYKVRN